MNDTCICREELGLGTQSVIVHIAWCPKSYFYQRAVREYEAASWIRRLFMKDPRRYYNFLAS